MANATSAPQTRVLIADDEENQRAGLAKMIQSWGYAVETAADGQEALDKLGQAPVHVLVTDLMMPRVDGFELLKRLQAQGDAPPSIVLTAFGNIETAVQTVHDLGLFGFSKSRFRPARLKSCWNAPPTKAVWKKRPSACSANCPIKAFWWI